MVSVGGWTGSLYYSTAVGSPANRTAFVKTVTSLATQYNLDGIDFEYVSPIFLPNLLVVNSRLISSWEYPGTQGIGCNTINPDDTSNFVAFLKELREDPVGKNLILTAATSVFPWVGPDGNRLTEIGRAHV